MENRLTHLLGRSLLLACGPTSPRVSADSRSLPNLAGLGLDLEGIRAPRTRFDEGFELRQHRMETDIGSLFEAQAEAEGKRVLVVDTSLGFRGSMREYEALAPKDLSQAVMLVVNGRTGEEENMNQIAAALRGGFFARAKRPARSEVHDRDVSPLDLHVQPVTVEPPVTWADERKERRKEHRQDRKKRRRNGRR